MRLFHTKSIDRQWQAATDASNEGRLLLLSQLDTHPHNNTSTISASLIMSRFDNRTASRAINPLSTEAQTVRHHTATRGQIRPHATHSHFLPPWQQRLRQRPKPELWECHNRCVCATLRVCTCMCVLESVHMCADSRANYYKSIIREIYNNGLTIWFARLCMPPIYLFPNPSAHAKHTPSTRRRAAPHSRVTCRLCAPSTPCWCYPLARAGTRCSPCVPPSPDCAEYGVRTACARCTRRAVCTRRRLRRRRHSPSCPPLSLVCRRYFFSSAGSSACLHLASCNHGESSVPRAGEASALVGSVRARASVIIAV